MSRYKEKNEKGQMKRVDVRSYLFPRTPKRERESFLRIPTIKPRKMTLHVWDTEQMTITGIAVILYKQCNTSFVRQND